jgi:hypothetical protein
MKHVSPRREQLFRSLRIKLKDTKSDPLRPWILGPRDSRLLIITSIQSKARERRSTQGNYPRVSRSGRRKGTTRAIRDPSRSSRSIPTSFEFDDQVLVVCCEGGSYKRRMEGGKEPSRRGTVYFFLGATAWALSTRLTMLASSIKKARVILQRRQKTLYISLPDLPN